MKTYIAKNETVELLENTCYKLDKFYEEFTSVSTDYCLLIGDENNEQPVSKDSLNKIYTRLTILEDFVKLHIDSLYKVIEDVYMYSRENESADKLLQMIEFYKSL